MRGFLRIYETFTTGLVYYSCHVTISFSVQSSKADLSVKFPFFHVICKINRETVKFHLYEVKLPSTKARFRT